MTYPRENPYEPDTMHPSDRYDFLCLLHAYVQERGTAAQTTIDIARELAGSIDTTYFADALVSRAYDMLVDIDRLNPPLSLQPDPYEPERAR